MHVHRERVLKVTWLLAVCLAVGMFGAGRLRNGAGSIETVPVSTEAFAGVNRGGVVEGHGRDTLVVFISYTCPFADTIFRSIDSVLSSDPAAFAVRFRHFVPPSSASSMTEAALFASCAASDGRFRDASRWMFTNRELLSPFDILAASAGSGIRDAESLFRCIRGHAASGMLDEDFAAAQALGITGTPAIVSRRELVRSLVSPEQLVALAARSQ